MLNDKNQIYTTDVHEAFSIVVEVKVPVFRTFFSIYVRINKNMNKIKQEINTDLSFTFFWRLFF